MDLQTAKQMKTPLPERIHRYIAGTNGIKASHLCAELAVEYIHLSKKEIKMTIITMIANKEIYEIEYTLPGGTNESLLLPIGSKLMGTN